jgi:hypothetical protein
MASISGFETASTNVSSCTLMMDTVPPVSPGPTQRSSAPRADGRLVAPRHRDRGRPGRPPAVTGVAVVGAWTGPTPSRKSPSVILGGHAADSGGEMIQHLRHVRRNRPRHRTRTVLRVPVLPDIRCGKIMQRILEAPGNGRKSRRRLRRLQHRRSSPGGA